MPLLLRNSRGIHRAQQVARFETPRRRFHNRGVGSHPPRGSEVLVAGIRTATGTDVGSWLVTSLSWAFRRQPNWSALRRSEPAARGSNNQRSSSPGLEAGRGWPRVGGPPAALPGRGTVARAAVGPRPHRTAQWPPLQPPPSRAGFTGKRDGRMPRRKWLGNGRVFSSNRDGRSHKTFA